MSSADVEYVSRRHLDRRDAVRDSQYKTLGLNADTGPIAGIAIRIFDGVVEMVLRLLVLVFDFANAGFEYITGLVFGNFTGLFPNVERDGTVMTYRTLRYIINVLLPPLGVFLNKGVYGWFNVLVCFILTYIHFFVGIIYAFLVTSKNRYADLYEKTEWERIKKINKNLQKSEGIEVDKWAFYTLIGFIGLLVGSLYLVFKFS